MISIHATRLLSLVKSSKEILWHVTNDCKMQKVHGRLQFLNMKVFFSFVCRFFSFFTICLFFLIFFYFFLFRSFFRCFCFFFFLFLFFLRSLPLCFLIYSLCCLCVSLFLYIFVPHLCFFIFIKQCNNKHMFHELMAPKQF